MQATLARATVAVNSLPRVSAGGKFLFAGGEKFYARGVSYGTFAPTPEHGDYPTREIVEHDFEQMAAVGVNVVRLYSAPPEWLLDLAHENGLRAMVGLAWEQHVTFLDERARARAIEESVRVAVRERAGHPAVLCYLIGNEIPASIVRWYGARRIERFLARLYRAAKAEDPQALVSYVNYPSTEYLRLPFLDIACFNVFLEEEATLDAYLRRLHNITGERPVIVTELGLDSRRHGERAQAASLDWQIRTAFRSGCAGAVVFSWTDEWHRGGFEIEDWGFGLTDQRRRPKPALAAVGAAFDHVPVPRNGAWPRISVVVCSHNGASTLADCLEGIGELDYPNFETIVIDDGSTDNTAEVAKRYDVRLLRTENRGLSSARNSGVAAADGDIVAFMDDDCRPDRHWLTYLATALTQDGHAAVGGPNVAVEDGLVAAAVARAPGWPIHVLLSDGEAEHIPGCNMAFWKNRLLDVGGFDSQFRVAGDDVDVCWRLQQRGAKLGFSPAAMVWHRARTSVRAFFRQQRGYGRAEALLERKWPEKYNRGGHLSWQGRVYGPSATRPRRWRVYYGTWGTGLFQSVYERAPGMLTSLPLMPEWYLLVGALAVLSALAFLVDPLCFEVPGLPVPIAFVLLVLAVAAMVGRAATAAWGSLMDARTPRLKLLPLTTLLYLLQPLARLSGRLGHGLTPWRRRGPLVFPLPRWRHISVWSEVWQADEERLAGIEERLRTQTTGLRRGGQFDRWDLMVRSGPLGAARLRMAVEEHGAGRQLVRFRVWPRVSRGGAIVAIALAALAALAVDGGWLGTAAILAVLAVGIIARMAYESATAVALLARTVAAVEPPELPAVLAQRARESRDEKLDPVRESS